MNVVLWIVQGLLAALFLFAGVLKTTRPKETLKSMMPWVEDFSPGMVRFIGTAELLGAVGLVLPWALDIASWLTPVAATALAIMQVGAVITHLRRGEAKVTPFNVVLIALAVFVAIGRFS